MVHGRNAHIGSSGIVEEDTIMGRCNTSWDVTDQKSVKKETLAEDCNDEPVYIEGQQKWPKEEREISRSISTEAFFDEDGGIERLRTEEVVTVKNLGKIKIITEIKALEEAFTALSVPSAVMIEGFSIKDKNWRTEQVSHDFCGKVFSMAGQIAFDTSFEKPGLSEIPRTQVLERYAMMRKNIRHSPSGPGVFATCYNEYLGLEPPTGVEVLEKTLQVSCFLYL